MLKKEFPGANPICLSLLFLPFTTMTVIMLSIILRGEGVIYLFPGNNDFITNTKISFQRVREDNNKKNTHYIAFKNYTGFVGTASVEWFLLKTTGSSSQRYGDLPAYNQSQHFHVVNTWACRRSCFYVFPSQVVTFLSLFYWRGWLSILCWLGQLLGLPVHFCSAVRNVWQQNSVLARFPLNMRIGVGWTGVSVSVG